MKKSFVFLAVFTILVLSASVLSACGNQNAVYLDDVNERIKLAATAKTAKYSATLYAGETVFNSKVTNFTRNEDGSVTVVAEVKSLNPEPTGDPYVTETDSKTYSEKEGIFPAIKEIKIEYCENEVCNVKQDVGEIKVDFVPNALALKEMFGFTDEEIASVKDAKLLIELTDKPFSYRLTYTVDGYTAVIELVLTY